MLLCLRLLRVWSGPGHCLWGFAESGMAGESGESGEPAVVFAARLAAVVAGLVLSGSQLRELAATLA